MPLTWKWIRKQGFKSREAFNRRKPKRNYDVPWYERAEVQAAGTCCSTAELTGLDGLPVETIDEAVMEAVMEYKSVVYYSNNKETARYLESIGFTVGQVYRGNHGKDISVMLLKV